MTYNETIGDVRTLAHEAGHAFHSFILREARPYARRYPMTLAESASTFAEMILTDGMLSAGSALSDVERLRLLDMETAHAAVYLTDIPVRYEFEKAFHEERQTGEVSVSRLKELMRQTQQRVFGDLLEAGGDDPYFWASKLHFYITSVTFYNFPYTFGFLLSRGLFSLFKQQGGEEFYPRYEQFLGSTGSATAEEVARRTLGCDLESPAFWKEAIETLRQPVEQLEQAFLKESSLPD
jgi:oligoendopeptidase F